MSPLTAQAGGPTRKQQGTRHAPMQPRGLHWFSPRPRRVRRRLGTAHGRTRAFSCGRGEQTKRRTGLCIAAMSAPAADDELGTMSAVSSEGGPAAVTASHTKGGGGGGGGGKKGAGKDRAAAPAGSEGEDEDGGGSDSGEGESSDGSGESSAEEEVREEDIFWSKYLGWLFVSRVGLRW